MRFRDFLSREPKAPAFDFEKFEDECRPFLEAIKGVTAFQLAWHGTHLPPIVWDTERIRDRKGPKHSPKALHDEVNNFFQDKFSWRARESGVFVTGARATALFYGTPCAVFPVGNFKSLWSSDIEDLTNTYGDASLDYSDEIADADREQQRQDMAFDAVTMAPWSFNKDLVRGLKSGNEIILGGDKMYRFKSQTDFMRETLVPALVKAGYVERIS